ncbi:flavodoxin family protein [Desulfopila sp. IMCC35006]|uniref:flavodoxin family protein n=1 Tax=Desulfopila sp. IMCC35006 TaxID=2569542 RepID=UPI0010AC740E|nr:flavodoxin family protein [Desulfopila sp. IMCC35006]TKB27420.1 flavodoxin family protein [Desulfopila sp. IMCC35006]
MKALVVYSSKTGNTRKLAEALFGALQCEKDLLSVSDNPDPSGYDFVAVGFWLRGGLPDTASQDFLPKIGEKEVFLFATHGAARDSDHARNGLNKAKELASPARICGVFSCPGQVAEEVLEKAGKRDPKPVWLADAPAAKGHPDAEDIRQFIHLFNDLNLP